MLNYLIMKNIIIILLIYNSIKYKDGLNVSDNLPFYNTNGAIEITYNIDSKCYEPEYIRQVLKLMIDFLCDKFILGNNFFKKIRAINYR